MGVTTPQHRADLFLDLGSDPREGGPRLGDERATLNEFLRCQRLTLQLKCDGLDARQLARWAAEPSTMSLLGLVRHMAEVERGWFRRRFAGLDVPRRYQTEADPDADFNGAVADPAVVAEAQEAWREEIAFAERFTRDHDLGFVGSDSEGEPVSLRELLVHMIEEYARHNGHADLLRERIDGRVGQLRSRQIQTRAIQLLRIQHAGSMHPCANSRCVIALRCDRAHIAAIRYAGDVDCLDGCGHPEPVVLARRAGQASERSVPSAGPQLGISTWAVMCQPSACKGGHLQGQRGL